LEKKIDFIFNVLTIQFTYSFFQVNNKKYHNFSISNFYAPKRTYSKTLLRKLKIEDYLNFLIVNFPLSPIRSSSSCISPRFLCRPIAFCSTCWSCPTAPASRTKSRRTAEESPQLQHVEQKVIGRQRNLGLLLHMSLSWFEKFQSTWYLLGNFTI
jgi:hypothetical protein